MPRRFLKAAVIILFSVSLFRLTAWAESSATIRVTATVVPVLGFDQPSYPPSSKYESDESAPFIRYAENIGVICNISAESESILSFSLARPGESGQTPQIKYYFPGPLVSLCDISSQIRKLAPSGDTCLVTIIYSEN